MWQVTSLGISLNFEGYRLFFCQQCAVLFMDDIPTTSESIRTSHLVRTLSIPIFTLQLTQPLASQLPVYYYYGLYCVKDIFMQLFDIYIYDGVRDEVLHNARLLHHKHIITCCLPGLVLYCYQLLDYY